jgi:hypothetical protein
MILTPPDVQVLPVYTYTLRFLGRCDIDASQKMYSKIDAIKKAPAVWGFSIPDQNIWVVLLRAC